MLRKGKELWKGSYIILDHFKMAINNEIASF